MAFPCFLPSLGENVLTFLDLFELVWEKEMESSLLGELVSEICVALNSEMVPSASFHCSSVSPPAPPPRLPVQTAEPTPSSSAGTRCASQPDNGVLSSPGTWISEPRGALGAQTLHETYGSGTQGTAKWAKYGRTQGWRNICGLVNPKILRHSSLVQTTPPFLLICLLLALCLPGTIC